MKNLISPALSLLLAIAIFTPSCAKRGVIQGSLPETTEDNAYVYLYDAAKTKMPIGSVAAVGRDFKLSYEPVRGGKALYTLQFREQASGETTVVFIVPEAGVITIDKEILQPRGTPLNDEIAKLYETLSALDKEAIDNTREKVFEAGKAFFMEHKNHPMALIGFTLCRETATTPMELKSLTDAGGKALERYDGFTTLKLTLEKLAQTQSGGKIHRL